MISLVLELSTGNSKKKHVAEDRREPDLTSLCLNGQGAEARWRSAPGKAWRAVYVEHKVQQTICTK